MLTQRRFTMHATRSCAAVLTALMLAAFVGCNSSGKQAKESTKAVDGLRDTQQQLARGQAQIDKALTALGQLESGQGDLQGAFKSYSSAVADVEAAGNKARARGQSMRARESEY